jgi:hypothetical protein
MPRSGDAFGSIPPKRPETSGAATRCGRKAQHARTTSVQPRRMPGRDVHLRNAGDRGCRSVLRHGESGLRARSLPRASTGAGAQDGLVAGEIHLRGLRSCTSQSDVVGCACVENQRSEVRPQSRLSPDLYAVVSVQCANAAEIPLRHDDSLNDRAHSAASHHEVKTHERPQPRR